MAEPTAPAGNDTTRPASAASTRCRRHPMPNGSTRLASSRTEGRGRESLGPVRYPCPVKPLHGSANDGVAKGSPPCLPPLGQRRCSRRLPSNSRLYVSPFIDQKGRNWRALSQLTNSIRV